MMSFDEIVEVTANDDDVFSSYCHTASYLGTPL